MASGDFIRVFDNLFFHMVRSYSYNSNFNKNNGYFQRWGATEEEDPDTAPVNEILDIEVSTICHGIGPTMETRRPCPMCYKSNTGRGHNMSLDTFKQIMDKQLKMGVIHQIAIGIGDLDANPDLKDMVLYCRNNPYYSVIPNITINGMMLTDEWTSFLAENMGAVSVSRYHIPDVCYDAVKKLTDEGLSQVNIHQILCESSYDECLQVLDDVKEDPRLSKLNAVVFLALKQKGRGTTYNRLDEQDKLFALYEKAHSMGINFGTDSCGAPGVLRWAHQTGRHELLKVIECCESSRMSLYIDAFGQAWPCSFCENIEGIEPINVLKSDNFFSDVWHSPSLKNFREKLISPSCSSCAVKQHCFSCPVYDITPCKEKDNA